MAGTTQVDAPGVTLIANNWFHDGWLAGMLGLPERPWDDQDNPVRDVDIDSWREGYRMARETGPAGWKAVPRMIELGQLTPIYRQGGRYPDLPVQQWKERRGG